MPRVKFDYVVSFSSEDKDNPANTLLDTEISRRKWLGEKGEASNSVVLQLAKSTRIQTVTIGSFHSALVEVLVGRSEKPSDPFKVLVLSSVFMSPGESKKDEPVSKVRTFQYEQLAAETRDQKWDRVRIVCLQPYNKHVKFGLSFIHIFEPESPTSETNFISKNLGSVTHSSSQRFQIDTNSSDDETSFKPGELFEKIKNSPKLSVDAQIRKASKQSSFSNSSESSTSLSRIKITTNKPNHDPKSPDEKITRDRSNILYDDEDKPNDKIDKIIQRDKEEKERRQTEINFEKKSKNEKSRENGERAREPKRSEKKYDDKDRHDSRKNTSLNQSPPKTTHRDDRNSKKEKEDTSDLNRRDRDKEKQNSRNNTNLNQSIPKNNEKEDIGNKRENENKSDLNKDEKSSRTNRKRLHSDERSIEHAKRLKPGPRSSSPHRLMSGVVFVLSGYQNPTRASLRDKALAMGAQYRQDWGDGCTHLICAYANTPKLRQVRSADDATPIVRGEWIEECCRRRRLVPWRWHATEAERRVQRRQSDDESSGEDAPGDGPECDTDDEIQKVLDEKKSPQKRDRQNSSRDSDVSFVRDERVQANVSLSDSETDVYTDEETESQVDVKINTDNSLPDIFEGFTFSIDGDLEGDGMDLNLLKRYIIAYSGEIVEHVCEDSTVNYVVTVNRGCRLRKELKSAVLVRPEWIWNCHRKRKKLPSRDFSVK